MNLKIVTLGEVSQTDKDKYCIVSVTYGILKKKKKQTHRFRKQAYDYQKGNMGWGGIKKNLRLTYIHCNT